MEHLSQQELCKGNLERGFFAGDLEGYVEEGSGDGHLSPWGPRWGAWKGVRLPEVYVLKKALEKDISLHGGPVKNLRGGGVLFTGNSERFLKEGSGNRASLPMGALLGEPGGGSITGDPEGYIKEGSGDGHLFS
jgi:hypothetical protein